MMPRLSVIGAPRPSAPMALGVFQREDGLQNAFSSPALTEQQLRELKEDGFYGKTGDTAILRPPLGNPADRVLVFGLGKKSETGTEALRLAAAAVTRRLAEARWPIVHVVLPDLGLEPLISAQTWAEGSGLASYRFQKHKSAPVNNADKGVKEISLGFSEKDAAEARRGLARGQAIVEAVAFARDLINEPPSQKPPVVLARKAKALAGRSIRVRVLEKSALARLGAHALLGVNRGSAHPPVMVHLHYKPTGKPSRRVAIVGKGVTFDSGGLSLKPADGMMTMKYDMAGAATVFALFHALPALAPSVEVHGIAPITENMPGPDAYKPGDVVRALNGKTIEVLNTDAEGRVILADALAYASRLPVDEIVDIATLTGAVTVALGKAYAALMSNNRSLEKALLEAGRAASEKMWPLPLEKSYQDHIVSKVADLKNIGNPGEAGTIIGGLFLEHFVGGKNWAHIDMAGVGWNSAGTPLSTPGATGAMVRALLQDLLHRSNP